MLYNSVESGNKKYCNKLANSKSERGQFAQNVILRMTDISYEVVELESSADVNFEQFY